MNKDVFWTPAMLEKFKAKINWDEFRTLWDWERIINRVNLRQLFNMAFYMKYSMQITTDKLGQSVMWRCLVEERVAELSKSLLSKVYGTK